MPSNAPTGLQPVTVTYNGTTSNPSPANIVSVSFTFFAFNGAGFGPAAAENIDTSGGYAFNSPQVSAKPGQIMVAYGTDEPAVRCLSSPPSPGNWPSACSTSFQTYPQ
jgi:uncharacterized protein (TIGR03437 family)